MGAEVIGCQKREGVYFSARDPGIRDDESGENDAGSGGRGQR